MGPLLGPGFNTCNLGILDLHFELELIRFEIFKTFQGAVQGMFSFVLFPCDLEEIMSMLYRDLEFRLADQVFNLRWDQG